MSNYVLDASAILAIVQNEPGAVAVWELMDDDTAVSAVNLAEVVTKLVDLSFSEEQIDLNLQKLGLVTWDFDAVQAQAAGLLREQTRPFGLSLGDRACLNLARSLGRTALTADRLWVDIPGVDVELFR